MTRVDLVYLITLFLILLGALTAFLLLFAPTLVFLAVIFVVLTMFLFLKVPKVTMIILGVYLLVHNLVAIQFDKAPIIVSILNRIEEVFILICFISMVFRNATQGKFWDKTKIDIPLALLLLVAILSTVKSQIVTYMVAGFDLFLLLKGFFIFYIFYDLNFNAENVKKVSNVFFIIGFLVFLLGILDLIFPIQIRLLLQNRPLIDYRFGISSAQSIFTHPAEFGWFMAFFACFCLAFYFVLARKRYLFFSILFIIGTIMSMRFKTIIGLAASILLIIIFAPLNKKIKFIYVVIILFLIFSFLFGTKVSLLFENRFHTYLQTPSLDKVARNALYITSFRIAKDYFPLGSGLATFGGWISYIYYSPLYMRYGINSVYGLGPEGHFVTDTFWPYIIGQFGVMGFALYILILLLFFKIMINIFKKSENLFLKSFTLGSIMVLIEALFESIASPTFIKPPQYFFIFAVLGITWSFQKLFYPKQ